MRGLFLSTTETAFDVSTLMQESVNQVQGDLMGVLAIVVPAIVVIVGAVVAVSFGIKWIKKLKSA